MSSITQYIIQNGIPEDIFILLLSIPIVLALIIFARRVIGSMTLGIYASLFLPILLTTIGIKNGVILFALIFISMTIIRYFLKKITFLSMADTRALDAVILCVLIVFIILAFIYIPFIKMLSLNLIIFLIMLVMIYYSEKLVTLWERRGFKRFISPAIESLALITASYFLINWMLIKSIILKYPLWVILICIILIALLAKWRWLKIKEYIRFKEVIKHVELPEKK